MGIERENFYGRLVYSDFLIIPKSPGDEDLMDTECLQDLEADLNDKIPKNYLKNLKIRLKMIKV